MKEHLSDAWSLKENMNPYFTGEAFICTEMTTTDQVTYFVKEGNIIHHESVKSTKRGVPDSEPKPIMFDSL